MNARTLFIAASGLAAAFCAVLMGARHLLTSSKAVLSAAGSYFWLVEFVLLTVFLFALAARFKRPPAVYVWLTAGALLLAASLGEAWFVYPRFKSEPYNTSRNSIHLKDTENVRIYGENRHDDPVLGYGPEPKITRTASRRVSGSGEVIYDVLYTTDEQGRRVTPRRGDKADTVVFIFGCSFTFGEGLNDGDSYPWKLGELLGEKYQVFNYGYHGYGSHQMLALIQSGRLDAVAARCKKIYALYLTIPDHELRSGGLSSWENGGPGYVLENGALRKITRRESMRKRFLEDVFYQSALYNALQKASYAAAIRREQGDPQLRAKLMDTHAAIIAESAREMRERYGSDFAVLVWPGYEEIGPRLRAAHLAELPLSRVMPDFAKNFPLYLIKGDGHPNANGAALVAEEAAAYIRQADRNIP